MSCAAIPMSLARLTANSPVKTGSRKAQRVGPAADGRLHEMLANANWPENKGQQEIRWCLGILAFDFAGEFFNEILEIRRKRINAERLLENLQSAPLQASLLKDHAHSSERPKVARLQLYGLVD